MDNKIVQYGNKINDVDLTGFKLIERRFLWSLLYKCKDSGKEQVILNKQDLLDLHVIPFKKMPLRQFQNFLVNTLKQCQTLSFHQIIESEDVIEGTFVPLFSKLDYKFTTDISDVELKFEVNQWAIPYLNNVIGGKYTKFQLEEINSLSSTYSQDLYRLLKQFRTTGYFQIRKKDLVKILKIPASYKESKIDQRVFQPAIKELSPIFKNLRVIKHKAHDGKVTRVFMYEFVFDPEPIEESIENKYEVKEKARKKEKLNRGLPDWYANTEQKPVDPEILQKALEAQKKAGEKSKELEGEQLPFDF